MPIPDDDPALTAAMDSAFTIMSRVITCASKKGTPLTDEEESVIEVYLAGHFYQVSDPSYSSRTTLNKSGSFLDPATGYQTRYMERAILTDPSGCLKSLLFTRRASIAWLGQDATKQRTYAERN